MTLHNRMTAFSFAAAVALAVLAPSAPAHAAEVVGFEEECVPFRAGFGIHQRCIAYVIYDDGTREASDHYNRDENGMMYDP
ncbi:MAG: hypothetical protein RR831_03860 [Stenotrophomonas sp.]|uniref:hypothetical protein n=1 Tax=Stenotrophomonas sp. NA06056 TaxID=2742129 RepID=UPI001589D607|nr:hypothetical protein [Stenotrophomonas sp. NA06056]QKW57157.1 hypothetical protein HUT07_11255 [Stenotrophomonas sp. NA06056]